MCLSVPGKILSIKGDDPLTRSAKVSFGGTVKDINLAYVPEAKIDDYVIVHVGFALNTIDSEEAEKVFKEIEQIQIMEKKAYEEDIS
ncbi:MAG: HypC/HybG/HupF family hydrogenase formation chaperone [Candidatus Aureabacteria bacterium]|nr:HypC/HybG/HupF family hydrogenase formation chaperone [Candidatus Auribacterota bacterium]